MNNSQFVDFYNKYLEIDDYQFKDEYEETLKYSNSSKFYNYYLSIIKRTCELIQKLKINDPKQVTIIFEYLLWNGYFSNEKNLIYSRNKKKDIFGAYGVDIMLGRTACLSNSDMLSKIFTMLGYENHLLFCDLPKIDDKETGYRPNIVRKNISEKSSIIKRLLKRGTNHAFVLVKNNNKHFISDPTNLDFLYFTDFLKAKYTCGEIFVNIDPFVTLKFEYTDKEDILRFANESFLGIDSSILYSEQIKQLSEETINLCKQNIKLLDRFYSDNISDIKNICKKI